jgi:hypothetical protein
LFGDGKMFAQNDAGKELSKKFGLQTTNEMTDRISTKQQEDLNKYLQDLYNLVKNAGTFSGENVVDIK